MIETVPQDTYCPDGWVVVRSYPWQDRGYAQADPQWLAEQRVTMKPYFEGKNATLMSDLPARWYDTIDDATVFKHEHDAAALALIIDGRVLRVKDVDETGAGWGSHGLGR